MGSTKLWIVSNTVGFFDMANRCLLVIVPLKRRFGRIPAVELTYHNNDDNSRQPGTPYSKIKDVRLSELQTSSV
jgi:hypothetical protein